MIWDINLLGIFDNLSPAALNNTVTLVCFPGSSLPQDSLQDSLAWPDLLGAVAWSKKLVELEKYSLPHGWLYQFQASLSWAVLTQNTGARNCCQGKGREELSPSSLSCSIPSIPPLTLTPQNWGRRIQPGPQLGIPPWRCISHAKHLHHPLIWCWLSSHPGDPQSSRDWL